MSKMSMPRKVEILNLIKCKGNDKTCKWFRCVTRPLSFLENHTISTLLILTDFSPLLHFI